MKKKTTKKHYDKMPENCDKKHLPEKRVLELVKNSKSEEFEHLLETN